MDMESQIKQDQGEQATSPPNYHQGQQPVSHFTYQQGQQSIPPISYQPQGYQPTMNYQLQQGAPQMVIQTQPVSTTAFIVQQPGKREWSTGLFACCSDMKSCCLASLSCFYYGCVASRMGESCCVGCSGDAAGCVQGGHLAMRARFRGTHNIQGDICGDCCTLRFCTPCVMCQLSREMDALGYPPGTC